MLSYRESQASPELLKQARVWSLVASSGDMGCTESESELEPPKSSPFLYPAFPSLPLFASSASDLCSVAEEPDVKVGLRILSAFSQAPRSLPGSGSLLHLERASLKNRYRVGRRLAKSQSQAAGYRPITLSDVAQASSLEFVV